MEHQVQVFRHGLIQQGYLNYIWSLTDQVDFNTSLCREKLANGQDRQLKKIVSHHLPHNYCPVPGESKN